MRKAVLVALLALALLAALALARAPATTVPGSRSFGTVPNGPTHGGRFPVSRASSRAVQPQPRSGSCRAIGRGELVEPDPRCTPGALSPTVTQATIASTICRSGYTRAIRPPESVTEREKRASMIAYGDDPRYMRYFEYDHLISLELGGAANDARNLWPEPGRSPNLKDGIENSLHRRVCAHQISLAAAQRVIATEWVPYYERHGP